MVWGLMYCIAITVLFIASGVNVPEERLLTCLELRHPILKCDRTLTLGSCSTV